MYLIYLYIYVKYIIKLNKAIIHSNMCFCKVKIFTK